MLVVAELYAHGPLAGVSRVVMAMLGGRAWTKDQHRRWLESAGLENVEIQTEPRHGWIAATGRRSSGDHG